MNPLTSKGLIYRFPRHSVWWQHTPVFSKYVHIVTPAFSWPDSVMTLVWRYPLWNDPCPCVWIHSVDVPRPLPLKLCGFATYVCDIYLWAYHIIIRYAVSELQPPLRSIYWVIVICAIDVSFHSTNKIVQKYRLLKVLIQLLFDQFLLQMRKF